MKRAVALSLCLVLIVGACIGFSACNYTRDENHLRGIYCISSSTYKDASGVEYNFADDYEYFLLIINKDMTASVRSKRVNEEENSYSVTLRYEFNADGEIDDVVVVGIKIPTYNYNSAYEFDEIADENGTSFDFRSFGSLKLVYKSTEIKTVGGELVSLKSKTTFVRTYKMTGDCNQKRAIRKQTKSIDDRRTAVDED